MSTAHHEAYDRFQKTRLFGSLDGLRAIAILVVLWHHSYEGPMTEKLLHRGFLGVDLFFVISGFLIVTLLLRERRRDGDVSLRGFYVRRSLRIFPPYYLMLGVVAAMAFLAPGNTSAAARHDLPFAFFYLSNLVPLRSVLGITWSLATEEQFYLVVPALEKYLPRLFPLVLLPVLYVLVSLPPFGFFPSVPWPGFFVQATFGPILLGVMLAHVLDRPAGYRAVHRLLGSRWSPLVALAATILVVAVTPGDITGWPRIAIHLVIAVLVASCVVREEHVLLPALSLWPMHRIGVVSYGIYLYHLLCRHAVVKVMDRLHLSSPVILFLGITLLSWVVAEISFRHFESRFLALKDRLSPARPRKAAEVVPVVGAAAAASEAAVGEAA